MANDPLQSVQNFIGEAANVVGAIKDAADAISDPGGFLKNVLGKNLPTDALPTFKTVTAANVINADGNDWRVRLTVPKSIESSPLLEPLKETENSMIFPFTPSIIMMHSANYNSLQPVHSNYPFPVYESSRVDDIQITGDFYVENSADAQYWIGAIHFLRTVTKMFYGNTSNAGAPPPVSRLNGYGDFVFNNLPVVITTFQVELAQDVDYIKTQVPGTSHVNWVPSHSVITVSLKPTFSRNAVRQFSLDTFVNGGYVGQSQDTGQGFI